MSKHHGGVVHYTECYAKGWSYFKPIQRGTTLIDEKRLCGETLSCITKRCSLTARDLFPAYLSGVVTSTFAVVVIRSLASFPAIAVLESEQLVRVGTLIIGAK